MIYIVKNNKVVMKKCDINKELEEFMKAEEAKRLRELSAVRDLHENSKKLVRKREK